MRGGENYSVQQASTTIQDGLSIFRCGVKHQGKKKKKIHATSVLVFASIAAKYASSVGK